MSTDTPMADAVERAAWDWLYARIALEHAMDWQGREAVAKAKESARIAQHKLTDALRRLTDVEAAARAVVTDCMVNDGGIPPRLGVGAEEMRALRDALGMRP